MLAGLGLLMVSGVPYRSFKEVDLRHRFRTIVLVIVALAVIVQEPSLWLFVLGAGYVASGPIEWAWRALSGRRLVASPSPVGGRAAAGEPGMSAPSSEQVLIFDTTLRDGEQSPGCSMNLQEKLTLARQLERLGVDVIEAGFPVASDGDFEAVKAVAREVRGPVICGLARTGADVERAGRALEGAARPRIHTFIATSDIHLEHKLRMSRERVLEEIDRAVARPAASPTTWSSPPRTPRARTGLPGAGLRDGDRRRRHAR
jgi:hypothetical protein